MDYFSRLNLQWVVIEWHHGLATSSALIMCNLQTIKKYHNESLKHKSRYSPDGLHNSTFKVIDFAEWQDSEIAQS